MNKAANKLAAGVRKIKGQQPAARPAERAPAPPVQRDPAPAQKGPGGQSGSALHPARVWPD